jgi:hypothetical protein
VCTPHRVSRMLELLAFAAANHRNIQAWQLSQASGDWTQIRQKMRNLKRLLKNRGYLAEFVWSRERGRAGALHVHTIAHGDRVATEVLQAVWGAYVHSQPVKASEARSVTGYIAKTVFKAGHLQTHLDLNGGRPAHWSRGFLGGDRKTVEAALRVHRGTEDQTWTPEVAYPSPRHLRARIGISRDQGVHLSGPPQTRDLTDAHHGQTTLNRADVLRGLVPAETVPFTSDRLVPMQRGKQA